MKLKHFFIPHPDTHKKAHLLSFPALLVYIALFIFLQFGIKGLSTIRPDILGVSSDINVSELIKLTNEQRQKNGLVALSENSALDVAAAAKAKNMFEENYWAHYSPSGKDPWGFITGAGYKFTYAGENLARNFHTSSEVVQAWMNSPTHKENIINTHYTNIGMAVAYGQINGQDTLLVVQEFGTPVEYIAQKNPTNPIAVSSQSPVATSQPLAALIQTPKPTTQLSTTPSSPVKVAVLEAGQSGVASEQKTGALIDSFQFTKVASVSLLSFLAILLAIDLIILRQRAVARISARHFSHFALMAVVASAIAQSSGGSIL